MIQGSHGRRLNSLINQLVLPRVGVLVRLAALALEVRVVGSDRAPGGVGLGLLLEGSVERVLNGAHVEAADGRTRDAVLRSRKRRVHHRLRLDEVDRLDLVEVERIVARNGAVQPGLQEGGPVVLEDQIPAAVVLADASDSGVDGLAAVDVLDGGFPEHEVDEVVGLERPDKVGLSQPERVVLDRSEQVRKVRAGHSVDGVVVAGEVGGAADEVVAGVGHERRAVGVWRVGALAPAVDPLGHLVDGLGLAPGALRAEGVSAASEDSISMRDLRNNFDEKNYRQ